MKKCSIVFRHVPNAALLCLALGAWHHETQAALFGPKKIRIVTTTTDLKSIAELVGGDKVKVSSIATGYQDPHFVDAKPSFMMKAKRADLFVRVGLELEIGYEELILEGARNRKIRVGQNGHLDVSNSVERLEVPTTQQVDRSMGDVHPLGNPHYWLDPINGKVIARNIANRLVRLRPADTEYFRKNASDFRARIDESLFDCIVSKLAAALSS